MPGQAPRKFTRRQLLGAALAFGATAPPSGAAEPQSEKLSVNGLDREYLLFTPAAPPDKPAPLVLGFHGHGGTMARAAASFLIQKHWPEAIVVYPQGLPVPGQAEEPQGAGGWQHGADQHGGRDLHFVDALLARLKKEQSVDESRIYAMGHSNGGAFTYLLWAARPEVFAAFAPSAAGSRPVAKYQPKPLMHIAGEKDPIVGLQRQERVMSAVRRINGCEATGQEWGRYATLYPSSRKAPFVALIHPGNHVFPTAAPPLIARFFQEHRQSH